MTTMTDTERPLRVEIPEPERRHSIEAQGLRKEFPGDVVAVDGIDLRFHEGEVFGFLGPNGAGKTTTVRMLTTLLRPTAGRATVAGFDLYRQTHEIRRSIGVALQEAGLDVMSTGRELLELQAQLFGMSGRWRSRRADELLELVGLVDAADRQIKTYSGGMKRRLDLASALVHGPQAALPGRADRGTRPGQPAGGLAGDQPAQPPVRRDRVPHDPLPGRGRPPGGPAGDHRPRPHRCRGHADGLKASIGGDVVTVAVDARALERTPASPRPARGRQGAAAG